MEQTFTPQQLELMLATLRKSGLDGGGSNVPSALHAGGGGMSGPPKSLQRFAPPPKVQPQQAQPPSPPLAPPQAAAPPAPTGMMGPPSVDTMGPPPPPSSEQGGSPSIFDNPDAVGEVLGMGDRNRQMATAEGLRDSQSPEGRYLNQGRTYVAGSGLEHAVSAYGKYKGAKDSKRLGAEQVDAKKRLIEMLRNKGA